MQPKALSLYFFLSATATLRKNARNFAAAVGRGGQLRDVPEIYRYRQDRNFEASLSDGRATQRSAPAGMSLRRDVRTAGSQYRGVETYGAVALSATQTVGPFSVKDCEDEPIQNCVACGRVSPAFIARTSIWQSVHPLCATIS
jgi:hypothetical protein